MQDASQPVCLQTAAAASGRLHQCVTTCKNPTTQLVGSLTAAAVIATPQVCGQIALEGQDLPRMYLAQHELESVIKYYD